MLVFVHDGRKIFALDRTVERRPSSDVPRVITWNSQPGDEAEGLRKLNAVNAKFWGRKPRP
jgi:hypothetical protein